MFVTEITTKRIIFVFITEITAKITVFIIKIATERRVWRGGSRRGQVGWGMGKAEREKGEGSGNGRMREVWREWRQLRGKGLDEWNGEEWWMGGTIENNGMIGGDRRREHWLSVAQIK
mgnify:CR=1 FL=1